MVYEADAQTTEKGVDFVLTLRTRKQASSTSRSLNVLTPPKAPATANVTGATAELLLTQALAGGNDLAIARSGGTAALETIAR